MPKTNKVDGFLFGAMLVALAVFLYATRAIINPILAFIILFAFLYPIRGYALAKITLLVSLFLFAIWFIDETRLILTPFAVSLALAYLFDPLVTHMKKLRIPRWVSVLAIEILVIGVIVLLLLVLAPQFLSQLKELVNKSVVYSKTISGWIESELLLWLDTTFEIDLEKIQDFAFTDLSSKIEQIFDTFFKSVSGVTLAISTAVGQLLNLVLIPFLFFYLLKDFPKIQNWVHQNLRGDTGSVIENYLHKIDTVISGFFRGQLIVCLIVGSLTTLGLWIFGVRYALLLGLMAGVLNIIPYIGLFSPSPWTSLIKIIAVIETVQILESSFFSPRIVGDRVGLHPAWVIFSILIFSHFWGILGIILAVPSAAVIKIFLSNLMTSVHKKHSMVKE